MPRIKGSKNKPLPPGVEKKPRKPYVSTVRNKRIVEPKKPWTKGDPITLHSHTPDEIIELALMAHTVTTQGELLNWLSEYCKVDGNSFVKAYKNDKHRVFHCNRGTRDCHAKDMPPENRRAATLGRAVGCPAKLKAYCFEGFGYGPEFASKEVYIIREGVHNHEKGQFLRKTQFNSQSSRGSQPRASVPPAQSANSSLPTVTSASVEASTGVADDQVHPSLIGLNSIEPH